MEELTSINHFDRILAENDYVFMDICADWCGPCKKIAPKIRDLAREYKNIKFISFDCDKCPRLAKELKVSILPTFILFYKEKIVDNVVGTNIDKIRELLDRVIIS
jgi:thioredoxin 1